MSVKRVLQGIGDRARWAKNKEVCGSYFKYRIVTSFVEKLTFEQRFEGMRELT